MPPVFRMYVGEARLINMNLAQKSGVNDLTGSPAISVQTGGPTAGTPTSSGKKIQCLYTATGTKPQDYTVVGTATDDGSTAQTIMGVAILRVRSANS